MSYWRKAYEILKAREAVSGSMAECEDFVYCHIVRAVTHWPLSGRWSSFRFSNDRVVCQWWDREATSNAEFQCAEEVNRALQTIRYTRFTDRSVPHIIDAMRDEGLMFGTMQAFSAFAEYAANTTLYSSDRGWVLRHGQTNALLRYYATRKTCEALGNVHEFDRCRVDQMVDRLNNRFEDIHRRLITGSLLWQNIWELSAPLISMDLFNLSRELSHVPRAEAASAAESVLPGEET